MRKQSPIDDNKELTDERTRQIAVERLQDNIGLDVAGSKADTEMVLNVMLHAASTEQSIEASCAELEESADSNTIREYLNDYFQLEKLEDIESQINSSLTAVIPRKVRRKAQEIGIDLHDQPFYGKDPTLLACTCGGEAKAGTTRFFRIATVYLRCDNVRLTLGVIFVLPDTDLVTIVANLLADVKLKKIRVARLYLDRGFANNAIYKYLLKEKYPAIILCPIRGKATGDGTRSLCKGHKSYVTKHCFNSQKHGNCEVELAMIRKLIFNKELQKRTEQWFAYVLIHTKPPLKKIFQLYRHRFAIESSYRLMRQLRVRTNSRNPMMRFIYMALGFILVNIWVYLQFLFTQVPKRGPNGRTLDYSLFRLKRFASFLRHAVERIYNVTTSISANVLPIGF